MNDCPVPKEQFVDGKCPVCGEPRYPRHPLTAEELIEIHHGLAKIAADEEEAMNQALRRFHGGH